MRSYASFSRELVRGDKKLPGKKGEERQERGIFLREQKRAEGRPVLKQARRAVGPRARTWAWERISASTGGSAGTARTAAAVASASTGGSATAARTAAASASASTGRSAASARSAAWCLMHPRAWRTSLATLVACVKYASVCVSPGSTPRGRTHTAAGRPGVGPGSGLTRPSRVPGPTYIVSPGGFPTPPRSGASVIRTLPVR